MTIFRGRLLAGEEAPCRTGEDDGAGSLLSNAHAEWRTCKPAGQLAILQDVDSGALLSGGVLDMIAVKHTPVRPVPDSQAGSPRRCKGQRWRVNVDAIASLTDEQKSALRAWTRTGGTTAERSRDMEVPAPHAGPDYAER